MTIYLFTDIVDNIEGLFHGISLANDDKNELITVLSTIFTFMTAFNLSQEEQSYCNSSMEI